MRKYNNNIHIPICPTAVGAGQNHYSELAEDVYNDRQTKIYLDSLNALEHDLKGLKAPITAEVGEVANGTKPLPTTETTVFQSMGLYYSSPSHAHAHCNQVGQK